MNQLPNINTHPVLTAIITVVTLLITLILGVAGGWTLRVFAESKAELSVVVDDGKFMQALAVQEKRWLEDLNTFDEKFHNENTIPDCITRPMPEYYHRNDYIVRSQGK